MSKSDFKKLVATYAPQCIEAENQPGARANSFPVVVQDLPCELSGLFGSLAKKDAVYTLDDLVRRIFEPAVAAVRHGVKLWIAVQDKANLVTVAKHPEWQKRAKNKAKASAQNSTVVKPIGARGGGKGKGGSKGGNRQTQLPTGKREDLETLLRLQAGVSKPGSEWYALFNHSDRSNKNFLVRQVTHRAKVIVPAMMRESQVPVSHRIVLDCEEMPLIEEDNGTFTHHEAEPVIWPLSSRARDLNDAANLQNDSEDSEDSEDVRDTDLVRQLQNKLGEYDVCFLHHLQADAVRELVQAEDEAVLLKTVDTDILLIAALRSAEIDVPVRVELTLPRGVQLPNESELHSDMPRRYFFDPVATRDWICTSLEARATSPHACGHDPTNLHRPDMLTNWQHLMEQFCIVYVMGGSDFCHDSIPNTSTLNLLLDYLQQGGPAEKYLADKLLDMVDVLSGRVNKSASARSLSQLDRGQRLQKGGLTHALELAKYIAKDYWSNSAHKHKVVTMPIGHGISFDGGALVFAAELEK